MTNGNRGYAHAECEFNVSEILETDDPLTTLFDMLRAIRETDETGDPTRRMRRKRGAKYRLLTIADTWEVANWSLVGVDYDRERIRLVDDLPGHVWAYIPRELTVRRIPDDAAYELARYHEHIIEKYDLWMAR